MVEILSTSPARYDLNPAYEEWKSSVEKFTYDVSGRKMEAFLDCPPDNHPDRVWLMFGGNASVALDWLPVTSFASQSSDAFVLFEYPGYGDSEGRPTRRLINRCVDEIIRILLERFQIEPENICDQFRVIGNSLGCAVALETAARFSIRRGIVISPFTSVREMGQMMFWKPLSYLAADPYDNTKSIERISETVDSPMVSYHSWNNGFCYTNRDGASASFCSTKGHKIVGD